MEELESQGVRNFKFDHAERYFFWNELCPGSADIALVLGVQELFASTTQKLLAQAFLEQLRTVVSSLDLYSAVLVVIGGLVKELGDNVRIAEDSFL